MAAIVLLLASFAVILAGALLFTNAVEWGGRRLAMGQGAVGSLLAAVGTAMPETLIPIVALIENDKGAEGVAIGAIIGAPFLLATIAMTVIGLSALAYRRRRPQGRALNADAEVLDRDLIVFLACFAAALALGVGAPQGIRIAFALAALVAYGLYVRRTLGGGGAVQDADQIGPLILARGPRGTADQPTAGAIVAQAVIALGAIIGGAHLFVEELIEIADRIGVEPLILSLVLAPLATELPEKANSFFWVREGKDSLALGNVTGAMVFQSTIPVAIGLAFTGWELDRYAALSAVLALAGGAVAYWALRLRGHFSTPPIVVWAALYAVFPIYVALS